MSESNEKAGESTAFVLINTHVAQEEEVLKKLKQFPEIVSVSLVYGIYDIIAKVKATTLDDLKKGVTGNLRSIPEIRSTMTMIAVSDN